jgi:hypothetical protein
MRRMIAVCLGALALAGCGETPAKAPPSPNANALVVEPAAGRTCDAASLTYLIGKPRTEIPVPVDPSRRRVACTTCPVSEDYQPDRTNILYDAQTGKVTKLKCG